MHLKDKKILIVGFGKSGQAALRFCLAHGAKVTVTDSRDSQQMSAACKNFEHANITWDLGQHTKDHFLSADMIVVSPGVPLDLEPLQLAKSKNIPIINELELATHALRTARDSLRIIAVTGTNGKSTTVSLIHHLLTTAGKKSLLAGNIGTPLLDCIDQMNDFEFLVLELSSYQLESAPSLKPDVAAWLNVSENHLDWHPDFAAYVLAKANLIRQTAPKGWVVYNVEDDIVSNSVEQIPSQRLMFSSKRQVKIGGWVEEGKLCMRSKFAGEIFRFSLDSVPMRGIPAWENMLAALLCVSPYITDIVALQKGLNTFKPLPHRMQIVAEQNGVTYINDSKATNVAAALKALIATTPPIIWLAGGKDKGGSYEPLVPILRTKVKEAVLFGEGAPLIAKAIKDATQVSVVADLKEAVKRAKTISKSGDTVLLSPACSSFDQFVNFEERGELFERWVNA